MIHKAKDLSPDEKLMIESLLGRRVLDEEAISIRAIRPGALSENRRRELARELQRYFAEVDASRQNVSAKTADEILTEAIRTSRPDYRSRLRS
jgi:hypothetical protein